MVLYTGEFKGSDPFEWPNCCLGRFEIRDATFRCRGSGPTRAVDAFLGNSLCVRYLGFHFIPLIGIGNLPDAV
mgnify:FL=1